MSSKGPVFGILFMLIAVWGWQDHDAHAYESGTLEHKLDIRVFGFRRSYLLHTPPGYDGVRPLPLMIVLHGGFSTGSAMETESGFSEIADREKFFVAYPNGFGLLGRFQHWNAGHCCGFAMKHGIDDVGFVSLVIDHIRQRVQIDSSRIYLVGYSNGGMLAYLFAARNPGIVAAVAGIAASIGSRNSPEEPELRIAQPLAPVPVIAFHGLMDQIVPYGGGRLNGPYSYVSVRESLLFWVKANQCAEEPIREEIMDRRVLKHTWKGSQKNREVVLYTLKGWDHRLPARHFAEKLSDTDPLRGLHAPEIIWEFFKKHSGTATSSDLRHK
ncbi:MAG: alpha/beta fold hydrolase [Desulfobacteraceae bacterium]|nr:MAG: alpha/beta fold hydrolase [Desulfobacteraceae bacterium]